MVLQSKKVVRSGLTEFFRNHPHQRGIIVCPERKFIYMKATKTAGTSILRGILENQLPGIIHEKDHPAVFRNWLQEISDRTLAEYFIFAVVRNPWDRVVSIASYFDLPLDDFLEHFKAHNQDPKIRIHALPLHLYTHIEGEQFCDLICRLEALQPDMNLVFDRIGLPRQQLPFLNPSDHRPYIDYYTQGEIDRVSEIYARDIQYYGYMFDHSSRNRTRATGAKNTGLIQQLITRLKGNQPS